MSATLRRVVECDGHCWPRMMVMCAYGIPAGWSRDNYGSYICPTCQFDPETGIGADLAPRLEESVVQRLTTAIMDLRERMDLLETRLPDMSVKEVPLFIDKPLPHDQEAENVAEIRRIQEFAAAWDAHTDPGRAWTRSQP